MGEPKGFLKVKREPAKYRLVCERIKDYREVCLLKDGVCSQEQASRCMDCGIPFCHWGCQIGNYIPEWNDAVLEGHWQKAAKLLSATNNLPEITARVCPAHCEYACVLGINDEPVTIRENELAIIEYAFREGIIKPRPAIRRTGKKVAVVGSGPAGLAVADQLNQAGHTVVVFERDDKIGGLLRYGIPDFKLEKWVIDRRIDILEKEGIEFITSVELGKDYSVEKLRKEFAAICLATGCRVARDLKIEGRALKGVYFALDYLSQSNRRIAGENIPLDEIIDAKDKRVVVLGGGDTGSDCVGVAHRQGANCVVQIELLPQPPECRSSDYPWPKYPLILKTSSSHEEGGERKWSVLTKKFIGENGRVKKIFCVQVEPSQKDNSGCPVMREIPGSEFELDADLIILALGFIHPEKKGLVTQLALKLDLHSNVKTDQNYMTSTKGIFACGDMHRGQSLVVWAISEGRRAAHFIDKYLTGESHLPVI